MPQKVSPIDVQASFKKLYWKINDKLSDPKLKELVASTLRSIALNYIQRKSPNLPKALVKALKDDLFKHKRFQLFCTSVSEAIFLVVLPLLSEKLPIGGFVFLAHHRQWYGKIWSKTRQGWGMCMMLYHVRHVCREIDDRLLPCCELVLYLWHHVSTAEKANQIHSVLFRSSVLINNWESGYMEFTNWHVKYIVTFRAISQVKTSFNTGILKRWIRKKFPSTFFFFFLFHKYNNYNTSKKEKKTYRK